MTFVLSESIRSERCKANLVFRGFFSNSFSSSYVVTSIYFLLMTFLYTIPTELKGDSFRHFVRIFIPQIKKKSGGTPINSRIPKRVKNKPWQLWLELIRRTAEGIFDGFLILGGSLKFPNQGKVSELCRLHTDESSNPLRRMVHSLFCLLLMHSLVLVIRKADFTMPLNVFIFTECGTVWPTSKHKALRVAYHFCCLFPLSLHLTR